MLSYAVGFVCASRCFDVCLRVFVCVVWCGCAPFVWCIYCVCVYARWRVLLCVVVSCHMLLCYDVYCCVLVFVIWCLGLLLYVCVYVDACRCVVMHVVRLHYGLLRVVVLLLYVVCC